MKYIILLLLSINLCAQQRMELITSQYQENEIYNLLLDHEGNYWVTTESGEGLSRLYCPDLHYAYKVLEDISLSYSLYYLGELWSNEFCVLRRIDYNTIVGYFVEGYGFVPFVE